MSNDLILKDSISKEVFLEMWKEEEKARKEDPDKFTQDRMREHEQSRDFEYFYAEITKNSLNNLILPYHEHSSQRISPGGKPFWTVIDCYNSEIHPNQIDKCLEKVCHIQDEIQEKYNIHKDLLKTTYRLGRIFSNHELAMPNHYKDHGRNKLYVGNIHRFIGYGLWIKRFGYRAINVIYCKNRHEV